MYQQKYLWVCLVSLGFITSTHAATPSTKEAAQEETAEVIVADSSSKTKSSRLDALKELKNVKAKDLAYNVCRAIFNIKTRKIQEFENENSHKELIQSLSEFPEKYEKKEKLEKELRLLHARVQELEASQAQRLPLRSSRRAGCS